MKRFILMFMIISISFFLVSCTVRKTGEAYYSPSEEPTETSEAPKAPLEVPKAPVAPPKRRPLYPPSPPAPSATPECTWDFTCLDLNECTMDSCVSGKCIHENINGGTCEGSRECCEGNCCPEGQECTGIPRQCGCSRGKTCGDECCTSDQACYEGICKSYDFCGTTSLPSPKPRSIQDYIKNLIGMPDDWELSVRVNEADEIFFCVTIPLP